MLIMIIFKTKYTIRLIYESYFIIILIPSHTCDSKSYSLLLLSNKSLYNMYFYFKNIFTSIFLTNFISFMIFIM